MKDYIILKGLEVEGVPEVIPILPVGHIISSKGEFHVDEESLKEMKAQIAKRGVDLVVDYEHQTLKGVQAPAAGWVKELKLEDGQIKALVEWTSQAAEYLKNREYRYVSPVITVRKTDSKATGLHSLALTNTPAIEGMTPIVNSSTFEGGYEHMDLLKNIAKLLELGEDATEEQITEALGKALNEAKSLKEAAANGTQEQEETKVVANKAVCELLGLKAGAAADDVSAKIMELKGGTINGVNIIEELNSLKKRNQEREASDAVTLALKSGKITPAQSEWAKGYALSDPKGFESFVAKAPQIVPLGEVVTGNPLALKSDEIDDATMFVCKQIGVTADDVKKYGKE